jgi:hypothetical protein
MRYSGGRSLLPLVMQQLSLFVCLCEFVFLVFCTAEANGREPRAATGARPSSCVYAKRIDCLQ